MRDGELDEALLDRAVRRVLTQKVELGLLDAGFDPGTAGGAVDLDSPENRRLARRMAEESVVLLKNDGVLPLAQDTARKVAVIGPSAGQPRSFLGCYSFTNHVLSRFAESGTGIEITSVVDALAEEFAPGGPFSGTPGASTSPTRTPAASPRPWPAAGTPTSRS